MLVNPIDDLSIWEIAADRIAQEPVKGNPYNNFIAVKTENANAPWVKTLVAAYQNDDVKKVFDKVYKGTGVTAW